jgi:Cu/Ag efflux protein CusF
MKMHTNKLMISALLAAALFFTNQFALAAAASAMPKMPGMTMPAQNAAAETGHAMGVVQSINATTNTVTIVTEAVLERNWPANMSMEYKVEGTAAASISAGQKVNFEFVGPGMDVIITKIEQVE